VYLADRIIVLSSPPSVVAEVIDVDLPRPRDHVTTKTDPRFVETRGHVTRILRKPGTAEPVG
jgi:NitT/TauT family transport system ATP-binding protein